MLFFQIDDVVRVLARIDDNVEELARGARPSGAGPPPPTGA